MSPRKRPDWAYETVYGPFLELGGVQGRSAQNPGATREMFIERMYRKQISELAMNRFQWEGLPKSIDKRYLEFTLFNNALAVFYFDQDYDKFLALAGGPSGVPNFYQNPTGYNITGNGSFLTKHMSARDVVPIWGNYMRTPDMDIILIYAKRLAELDRTIEINSKNSRVARVLLADENSKLSGDNIMRQFDNGNPVITINSEGKYGAAGLQDMVTSLTFNVDPDETEKLHILRTRIWGECMGLLGIDFANQDKKERLVAAEVGANSGQIDAMRRVNLNAREEAAARINEKYGPGSRFAKRFPDHVLTDEVKVSYWVDESTTENLYELDPSDNNGANAS